MQTTGCSMLKIFYDEKKNALREFDMQPWYKICLNYRKKTTTTNADIIVKQFFFSN